LFCYYELTFTLSFFTRKLNFQLAVAGFFNTISMGVCNKTILCSSCRPKVVLHCYSLSMY